MNGRGARAADAGDNGGSVVQGTGSSSGSDGGGRGKEAQGYGRGWERK